MNVAMPTFPSLSTGENATLSTAASEMSTRQNLNYGLLPLSSHHPISLFLTLRFPPPVPSASPRLVPPFPHPRPPPCRPAAATDLGALSADAAALCRVAEAEPLLQLRHQLAEHRVTDQLRPPARRTLLSAHDTCTGRARGHEFADTSQDNTSYMVGWWIR